MTGSQKQFEVYALSSYWTGNTLGQANHFLASTPLIQGLKKCLAKPHWYFNHPKNGNPVVSSSLGEGVSQINAADYLAEVACSSNQLLAKLDQRDKIFVPIPSKVILHSSQFLSIDYPSYYLASYLAEKIEEKYPWLSCQVENVFSWKKHISRAHDEEGSRNSYELYENLMIRAGFYAGYRQQNEKQVILIDDFVTSGAHMEACGSKLYEKGFPVDFGIAASQPAIIASENVFKVRSRMVDFSEVYEMSGDIPF